MAHLTVMNAETRPSGHLEMVLFPMIVGGKLMNMAKDHLLIMKNMVALLIVTIKILVCQIGAVALVIHYARSGESHQIEGNFFESNC